MTRSELEGKFNKACKDYEKAYKAKEAAWKQLSEFDIRQDTKRLLKEIKQRGIQ